jgi:uncharacterized membrane protein
MISVACAAAFLLVTHCVPARRRVRDAVVARIGERGYLAAYSGCALLAFVALGLAYQRAPRHVVWIAPAAVKLAMAPLVAVGFVLVVTGLTTPNPTIVGADRVFDRPDAVHGILRVTRNPFLWGAGLSASAHVVATGDLAGIVVFGAVALLGLGGTLVLDAKKARTRLRQWGAFARSTSNVPFAAILAGRQRLAIAEIGWWRVALAAALFCAVALAHRWITGMPALPGFASPTRP